MLSVLIAARQEMYLQHTIDSVIDQSQGDIEVLVVLDGYWPNPAIREDKRITLVHYPKPIGQRRAINVLARIAKGEYIMKLDAHCIMGEGYDEILKADCQDKWIVVPRRYDLDVGTFCRRGYSVCDYMFLTRLDAEGGPLRAKAIKERKYDPDKPMIDDTMACQGSCFFMKKSRFEEIDGLDEAHGSLGWLGCEISCKSWLGDGQLKVNKNTWYAHWQKGKQGHRYHVDRKDLEKARDYAVDMWTKGKWPKQKRDLQWLQRKFNI